MGICPYLLLPTDKTQPFRRNDAMPTRICRWVTDHPIAFALIFFVFYLIGFFTLEQLITEPVYLIHCTLDDWIPFNEWFIFAYGSWFFLIPWALITLLRRDRSNYFYLCAGCFPAWQSACCCICCSQMG